MLDEIYLGGKVENDDIDRLQQIDFSQELPSGFSVVSRIGEYKVVKKSEDSFTTTYILVDGPTAIGYLALNRMFSPPQCIDEGSTTLEANVIYIAPEYRGKNLALALYEWVLTHVCDFILAGEEHTEDGAALWRKLSNSRKFAVFVYDPETDKCQRWPGQRFNRVYDREELRPFVTLRSKGLKMA